MKNSLCGMTPDDLFESFSIHGFTRLQAEKVLIAVYRKGVTDLQGIKNIPKSLKDLLSADFKTGICSPVALKKSADYSIKYLFRNSSGLEFETVYLPDKKRDTVCVSTQAGCRMGCPFCLTGRLGFKGNLGAGDIINQVVSLPQAAKISHVVFMGMGEPMDNVEEIIKACRILTSQWGLSVSCRNITVSTVGIKQGLIEFLTRSDCNLTLSLFSPFPGERKLILPAENKNPVREILDIMKSYPAGKKRRFSVAYVMIRDINDTDRHLDELKKLLLDSRIRVNLLSYHRTGDDSFYSSGEERLKYFKHNLVISGISASIRKSRGEDISAACGLLASGQGKFSLLS
jgi:23S rRNA (adenine2503-C2)-methyltransferase